MNIKVLCVFFLSFSFVKAQNDTNANSTSPQDIDSPSERALGNSKCGLSSEEIKKIHANWCDTFATKKYEDLRKYYAPGGKIELPMLEPFTTDNETSFTEFVKTVRFLTEQFNVSRCEDYEIEKDKIFSGCENSKPPAWFNGTAARQMEFFGIPMDIQGKFHNQFLDIKGEPKIILQKFEIADDSMLKGLGKIGNK